MILRKTTQSLSLAALLIAGGLNAQSIETEQKVEQLEKMVQQMMAELQELKKQQAESTKTAPVVKEEPKATPVTALSEIEVRQLKQLAASSENGDFDKITDKDSWINRLTLGGYGEMHVNMGEGDTKSKFDLHRLVLYTGYEFNDWLKFNAETEIEHAFVSDGDGELVLEQAYVDALLYDSFNLRFGRVLAPLGITNQTHEPTTFNGVERPLFDKYMIPTTWSLDGIGAFGNITDRLSYQAYLTGSLDGSGFDDKDGIRGGRIKTRQSLNAPAISGRLDYYAIKPGEMGSQSLRVGVSGFHGGLDNKDGGGESGTEGNVTIISADYQYSVGIVDLRGVIAHTSLSDAELLGDGVGEEQFGFYQDIGLHIMPDSWKTGKLAQSDLIAFARYDYVDTQAKLSDGSTHNPAAKRTELTLGLTFLVTPQFVVKADYQIREDESDNKPNNLYNFGVGFNF